MFNDDSVLEPCKFAQVSKRNRATLKGIWFENFVNSHRGVRLRRDQRNYSTEYKASMLFEKSFGSKPVSYQEKNYRSWTEAYNAYPVVKTRIPMKAMYRAFRHYIPIEWVFDAALAGVSVDTPEKYEKFEKVCSKMQDTLYRASMLNRTVKQQCGLNATIVDLEGDSEGYIYHIRFEDGSEVEANGKKGFIEGKLRHPILMKTQIPSYKGLKLKYMFQTDEGFYYETECLKCGERDLMSVRKLILYAKEHEACCL